MTSAIRENKWLRHGVFILLNLATVFVVLELVILPILTSLSERDAEIIQQRQLLAHLTAIAAQAPAVQKLLEPGGPRKNGPEFLRGPNQSVIIADLQSRLSGMIGSAGGQVRSIRSLSPKMVDGIAFVGAQVEFSGPLRAVQQSVHSIESSTPFLFVMDAAIKPSTQFNFPGAGPGAAAVPTLDARLDILGALEPEERN